jgi:hypothetical protein
MSRKAATLTPVSVAPTALFATIRHPKKRAFLQAYLTVGKVLEACQASHLPHSMHYYWKRTDPVYAEAFAEARTMLGEQLEEVAFERAYAGSDTLLIFLLKGAMPHKYSDKVAHTDHKGGPLVVKVVYENAPQESPS